MYCSAVPCKLTRDNVQCVWRRCSRNGNDQHTEYSTYPHSVLRNIPNWFLFLMNTYSTVHTTRTTMLYTILLRLPPPCRHDHTSAIVFAIFGSAGLRIRSKILYALSPLPMNLPAYSSFRLSSPYTLYRTTSLKRKVASYNTFEFHTHTVA